jgi:hypothetical protein
LPVVTVVDDAIGDDLAALADDRHEPFTSSHPFSEMARKGSRHPPGVSRGLARANREPARNPITQLRPSGGFFMTIKPASSKWRTTRSAAIAAMYSSA